MPANNAPIFPNVIQNQAVSFVNADGTAEKTLVTGGTNGTRIDAISVTSDDTSNRDFRLSINNGATSYIVGEITVPLGAGTDGATKAKKVLNSADLPWLDASGALFIKAGWKLNINAKVAVTAAKTVAFVAHSGDY